MSASTQTSGGKHCNTRAEGEMNANRPFSIPMSMSAHLHLHYRANLFNSRKHYCMQLSQTGKSRRLLLLLLSVKERHVKAHRLQAILHKRRPVTREREKGGGEEVKREREKRGGEGVKRERDKGASIEKTPCTYSHAHTRTHTRTHSHALAHLKNGGSQEWFAQPSATCSECRSLQAACLRPCQAQAQPATLRQQQSNKKKDVASQVGGMGS